MPLVISHAGAALSRAFNRAGLLTADGQLWTEQGFLAEMRRLGA